MTRHSIAVIATFFLLTACYVEVAQSATATWRISSNDGNEEDKEILKSISSLAFKHLLAYAYESVESLAIVYNTTQTLHQKISILRNSMSQQQKILADGEYDQNCNKNSNQDRETCYQCKKRVCYDYINQNCDLDSLEPPSQTMLSEFGNPVKSSSVNHMKLFVVPENPGRKDLNTLHTLGEEKTKNIEVEVEDKQKPIGLFSDLFGDIKNDVASFETVVLEEISDTVLEPVAGFSDDAFDESARAFDETVRGAEVAFNKLKDWGDSLNVDQEQDVFSEWGNLDYMDYSWFAVPTFTDDLWDNWDYKWEDIYDGFDNTWKELDEDLDSGLDGFTYGFQYIEDGLEENIVKLDVSNKMLEASDAFEEIGSDASEIGSNALEEGKKVFKKLKPRWKRSVPEKHSKPKNDKCEKFSEVGEWKFCESFETDPKCQSRCKAEEDNVSLCSKLIGHAEKLNDFMDELEEAIGIEQQLVREALEKHGWVAVLLQTMKFKQMDRDHQRLSLEWIEIDPDSFSREKAWLFDDITVGYRLNQKWENNDRLYDMGNQRSKVKGPSNVLNIYDLDATKPLAETIIRDMNRTLFAQHGEL